MERVVSSVARRSESRQLVSRWRHVDVLQEGRDVESRQIVHCCKDEEVTVVFQNYSNLNERDYGTFSRLEGGDGVSRGAL